MPPRARDRGRKRGNDPLLKTKGWARIRRHWIEHVTRYGTPCARCHGRIDPAAPKGHPKALIVGHIVSRARARALGWTPEQINALSNTQPECTTCSARSGARDTNRIRRQGRQARQSPTVTATADPKPRPMTSW